VDRLIRTTDLKKTYLMGKVEVLALKGINIHIRKGEFVAIMGPSGSGKSTLLRLMGLLDNPTAGTVELDGMDVQKLSDRDKVKMRLTELGYVFQEYALLPELSGLKNVYLLLLMMGKTKKESIEEATDILIKVGLGDRIHHMPHEMSGGEQQRVAIARALVADPKIIFADEPCANLDTESSGQILELFNKLNRELDQTIVMVTHEEWHAKYADRVVKLKDGVVEKEY
jgi:putative ABC transport system ATP-binding protein